MINANSSAYATLSSTISGDCTILCKVRVNSAAWSGGEQFVFSATGATNEAYVVVNNPAAGSNTLAAVTAASGSYVNGIAASGAPTTFSVIALVRSGTAIYAFRLLDGDSTSSATQFHTQSWPTADALTFYLFGVGSNSCGNIDVHDVRIFDIALTAAQIADQARTERNLHGTDLIHHYWLENATNWATDTGSSATNLTTSGTPTNARTPYIWVYSNSLGNGLKVATYSANAFVGASGLAASYTGHTIQDRADDGRKTSELLAIQASDLTTWLPIDRAVYWEGINGMYNTPNTPAVELTHYQALTDVAKGKFIEWVVCGNMPFTSSDSQLTTLQGLLATEYGTRFHDIQSRVPLFNPTDNASYYEASSIPHLTDAGYTAHTADFVSWFNAYLSSGAPFSLSSAVPADNATSVRLNSTIALTYSDAVSDGGAGSYYLRKTSDNSLVQQFSSGQFSISSATVTLTPSSNLLVSTGYYIEADAGVVERTSDASASPAISGSTTLNFTTMAPIEFGAISTFTYSASGGTSVTTANYSELGTIVSGDEIQLWIAMKPSTANSGSVTTPSGYSLVTSLTGAGGYGATLGADTGNTNLYCYKKDSVTGSESGTVAVTVATNNVCASWLVRYSVATGYTISRASTTGSDTSAGNVSVTGAADPGFSAGDEAIWAFSTPTDVTTPAQYSAHAITATGATFGTAAELGEWDSGTGNDIGGFVARASVTAGPSSAAPVFTATAGGTTTNVRGPGVIVRLRATAPTATSHSPWSASQRIAHNIYPRRGRRAA